RGAASDKRLWPATTLPCRHPDAPVIRWISTPRAHAFRRGRSGGTSKVRGDKHDWPPWRQARLRDTHTTVLPIDSSCETTVACPPLRANASATACRQTAATRRDNAAHPHFPHTTASSTGVRCRAHADIACPDGCRK